jgi:hypothetical protein
LYLNHISQEKRYQFTFPEITAAAQADNRQPTTDNEPRNHRTLYYFITLIITISSKQQAA